MSSIIEQLEYVFNPRSVAVIGASSNFAKWGHDVIARILASRQERKVYPINTGSPEILGIRAYKSVTDVPAPVEFAVIVIPFPGVPTVMRECVEKEVKAALIITAGLGEAGAQGAQIEAEIVQIARKGGLRFVGPNCMGHFNTAADLFTVRGGFDIEEGSIGLISQSGGFAMEIIRAGLDAGVGFSKCVSSGNEADLHFEDYLEYLAYDKETKVIVGYIEGLREARRFLKLAKEITLKKPIVVMKVGRTSAGAMAARSHTGALAGQDAVYDRAFKQAGVIRVDEIHQIFDIAAALLRQPLPRGKRVGILSAGGGHGVVASDACLRAGLEVASLSPATIEELNRVLPSRWPHANPVDTVAAGFVTYPSLWPLMEDDNIDSVLAVGSIGMVASWGDRASPRMPPQTVKARQVYLEQVMHDELANLDRAVELMDKLKKPLIVCTMYTQALRGSEVFRNLRRNGILMYPTPERAVKVLAHLVEYSQYLTSSG
jgi:acyl-CoA synthetase (NDP forming)